jgi:hypothetical protein
LHKEPKEFTFLRKTFSFNKKEESLTKMEMELKTTSIRPNMNLIDSESPSSVFPLRTSTILITEKPQDMSDGEKTQFHLLSREESLTKMVMESRITCIKLRANSTDSGSQFLEFQSKTFTTLIMVRLPDMSDTERIPFLLLHKRVP